MKRVAGKRPWPRRLDSRAGRSRFLAWVGVAFAFLIGAPREALASAAQARFALVIGNNHGETPEETTLSFADDDAAALHEVFLEQGTSSVLLAELDSETRASHPETRSDGPPTLASLRSALDSLYSAMRQQADVGARVEFFLFFSGHGGASDGEGYVALGGGRLSRSELSELLQASPAALNHVFIDACSSFLMAHVGSKGQRGPDRSPYVGPLPFEQLPSTLDNTGFVLSTASERDSHEWGRYRGGILSHELRSALRGGADANLDGHITYLELQTFLEVANAGVDNPNFRPEISVRGPGGTLALDVLSRDPRRAAVRVRGGKIRHFYVEDVNGVRLLDAHPEPGQVVQLWLPERRPVFVRANDGRRERLVADHEVVTIEQLEPAELALGKSGGALGLALKQLFRLPYGLGSFGPMSLERDSPLKEPRRGAPRGLAALAIGASTAGALLGALALGEYQGRRHGTQLEQEAGRDDFRRYLWLSLPCFAVGAVSGGIWASLRFSPGPRIPPQTAPGAPGLSGVTVGGVF